MPSTEAPPRLWLGPRLVLASRSAGRAALLRSAGLDFAIDPARLDERAVEEECRRRGVAASGLAARLAEAKALDVSARHPDALCLGADQTLTLDGRVLHKPKDMTAARDSLQSLAGRTHRLASAFCFARNGEALFQAEDEALMTMRPLDRDALSAYLSLAGEAALASVGAYQVEGLGAHLFDRIEGDHTTIIGLPLLPVLAWLRRQGYLGL